MYSNKHLPLSHLFWFNFSIFDFIPQPKSNFQPKAFFSRLLRLFKIMFSFTFFASYHIVPILELKMWWIPSDCGHFRNVKFFLFLAFFSFSSIFLLLCTIQSLSFCFRDSSLSLSIFLSLFYPLPQSSFSLFSLSSFFSPVFSLLPLILFEIWRQFWQVGKGSIRALYLVFARNLGLYSLPLILFLSMT